MNFNRKMKSEKSLHHNKILKQPVKKNIKLKNQNLFILKVIQENFIDFCNGTNLHGFRQITETIDKIDNSKIRSYLLFIKNIIWSVIIIFGFGFGSFLLSIVFARYQTTPTITTVESNNYGIWNIPFPAVTICNSNTVYAPNTARVTQILLSKNVTMAKIKEYLSNLPSLILFEEVNPDFFGIYDLLVEAGYNSMTLMKELAHPCERLIKSCKWLGRVVDCKKVFRITRSDLGYCCSFNYKALQSFIRTTDCSKFHQDPFFKCGVLTQDEKKQMVTPIIHIAGAGEDVGLHVILNLEEDYYVAPRTSFYGAKVIIHDPSDFPDKTLVAGVAQSGNELRIGIQASVVATDDSIESFPVDLRFCLFDKERTLKLTEKYSYQSCITECRIKTILEICKCLPYYYPFTDYNNISNIKPCNMRDLKCLSDNKSTFASLKPPHKLYIGVNYTTSGMDCNCLPNCKENRYGFETFTINRTDANKLAIISRSSEDSTKVAVLRVQFKELSCIKYRREIFMTWDNLLASFGGIFGLCLGGSVLSLIEIIYFATFKFIIKYLSNDVKFRKDKHDQIAKNFLKFFNKNDYYQESNFNALKSKSRQRLH